MITTVSSTEVARHLGDYLARVKHKGERFILTKNHRPVAELSPTSRRHGTVADLLRLWRHDPEDPAFADDLEKANSKELPEPNPWAS